MTKNQAAVIQNEGSIGEIPHHYRILVVDDNKACATTMMWTLEILGHTVRMALDGPTAIELAIAFQPDIIFLDIGMPEMNGYEVCQAMRNEPILKNTIFIAKTGWGQKEHRERSKEAGFSCHLVKPVDIETLKRTISGLHAASLPDGA